MSEELQELADSTESEITCFSFGGAEQTNISELSLSDPWYNPSGQYWEPPIPKIALAGLLDINSYHGSLIAARVNHIMELFVDTGTISYQDAYAIATDLLVFGEAYYQRHKNNANIDIRLSHIPSLGMRQTGGKNFKYVSPTNPFKVSTWRGDDIFCIKMYDVKQSLYGRPDYLSGASAASLSNHATLLRTAYYKNGSHLGYILYTNEPSMGKEEEKALREALTKAQSNRDRFKPFYLNLPGGNEKGIQVIPLSEVGAKDIFPDVKNISAQDIMVAHRYPSNLSGIISGDGKIQPNPITTKFVYMKSETFPLCRMMMTVNDILGLGHKVEFKQPELEQN